MTQPVQPSNRILSYAAMLKRLTVGTVLINLIALTLVCLSIYHSRLQYQDGAEIATQNLARVLDENIDGSIDQIDIALLSVQDEVKRELAAGGIHAKALNLFLAQQLEHQPDILSLRAMDAQGWVRYGVGVPPEGGPKNSDREHFIRARDESTPDLIVTKPMFARIDKKWVVVLARRLSQPDGSFAGAVYANVALDHLSRTFSEINVGPHGSITLRGSDLGLVVRYPKPENLDKVIGSKPSLEGQKQMQADQSRGTLHARNPLDNVERIVSYRKMSDKPFYINVGVADDDYLATWRKESVTSAALMLLFFLSTLLSSWLILRSWKRQIVAAETIREQKDFLDAILESEPECVKVIGLNGELVQMNRAGLAMLEVDSFQEAEKIGLLHFVLPEYRESFLALNKRVLGGESGTLEFQIEGKNGTRRWLDTNAMPLHSSEGKITGLVGVARDVTERKNAEEQVKQLAYFDPLTKLPNRRMLLDRINHALAQAKRFERSMAIMFLDLDNFKSINDTMGHDVGDELLKEVARRLMTCVRSGDTVCRQGGDEFVVVLEEIAESKDAALVAEKIVAVFGDPVLIAGRSIQATTSIGIAVYPISGTDDILELMKKADKAMYAAKAAGRNGYRFFSD